mgnify:CR=1 FL=1
MVLDTSALLAVLLRDAGHDVVALKRRPEGLPEGVTPLAADLAEDDRVHDDVPLVPAKPVNNRRVGICPCGFAQYVGIHEEFQRVSVGSESTATK